MQPIATGAVMQSMVSNSPQSELGEPHPMFSTSLLAATLHCRTSPIHFLARKMTPHF